MMTKYNTYLALKALVQAEVSDGLFDHEALVLEEFVDKLYRDFESRTCLDCRHFQNQINDSEIACDLICGFFSIEPQKYCGAFELKELK